MSIEGRNFNTFGELICFIVFIKKNESVCLRKRFCAIIDTASYIAVPSISESSEGGERRRGRALNGPDRLDRRAYFFSIVFLQNFESKSEWGEPRVFLDHCFTYRGLGFREVSSETDY